MEKYFLKIFLLTIFVSFYLTISVKNQTIFLNKYTHIKTLDLGVSKSHLLVHEEQQYLII